MLSGMFRDVLSKRLESDQQIILKKKILYTVTLPSYAQGSCSTELKTSLHVSLIIALQFEGYCITWTQFPQPEATPQHYI